MKQAEQAPLGAAFLISAMTIFPLISAITLDTAEKTMTIEFVYLDKDVEFDHLTALHKLKSGLKFFHQLEPVRPVIFLVEQLNNPFQKKLKVKRDLRTLSQSEIKCMVDLFDRYFAEDSDWEEIPELNFDQYAQHNQLYQTLYQYVVQGDYESIRAFRDTDTIYVHQMSNTNGGVKIDK